MLRYLSFLAALCFAGCATERPPTPAVSRATAEKPVVREAVATHEVETRYELRGYRDADDPGVRHDAHAVYRRTRVPARVDSLEVEPRSTFAPVSYAPLPPSAELSAELTAQKQITAELRTIEARMLAVERQAQGQYGTLVGQTAETIKVRQQLEEERSRTRELETKTSDRAANVSTAAVPAPVATEPKW